jgi:hypothetical protein
MLKPSSLLLLLCLAGTVYAKPFRSGTAILAPHVASAPDKDASYSEIVDCGSVTQIELFRRARLYLAQTAYDNKTLVADKETGDLVSGGSLTITVPRSENSSGGVYVLQYVLAVECANRKYRATISGKLQGYSKIFSSKSEKESDPMKTELESRLKGLLQELQVAVKDYKPF